MAEGSARILVVDDEHWGDSGYRDPRTIDVHIRRPSEKPEPDPNAQPDGGTFALADPDRVHPYPA